MLTINQCREKLEKNSDKKYTEIEVVTIRDFLYKLAQLNVKYIKQQQLNNLKSKTNYECK